MKTVIQKIAESCQWHKTVNEMYMDTCNEDIEEMQNVLPSGSGFDSGCKIDVEKSGESKVIINFSYHHMNNNGYYDGWTEHELLITPKFNGWDLRISGTNKNQVKDYFYDTFNTILNSTNH